MYKAAHNKALVRTFTTLRFVHAAQLGRYILFRSYKGQSGTDHHLFDAEVQKKSPGFILKRGDSA